MTSKQILKLLFHRDVVMLFASAAFFFMTFLSIRDYGLKLSNLDKYQGVFVSCDSTVIKVINKPLFKQVTQRSDLKLENIPYYFSLQTKKDFSYLTSQIKPGDTLLIWTKTKKTDLSKTNFIAINHLVAKNKIIVDFYKSFSVTPGLILFSLIPAFGFSTWYYVRTKKRFRKFFCK